jgi:hypothetical protein
MMHLPAIVRVYLCASACDMHKSFDGLHARRKALKCHGNVARRKAGW